MPSLRFWEKKFVLRKILQITQNVILMPFFKSILDTECDFLYNECNINIIISIHPYS